MTALTAVSLIGPAQAGAVVVRDASGRAVAINDSRRIVAVGGAITEILYAMGLERRLVGVDSTSFYPPRALAEKPNVGYAERIVALDHGRVAADGAPHATITDELLDRVFGVALAVGRAPAAGTPFVLPHMIETRAP